MDDPRQPPPEPAEDADLRVLAAGSLRPAFDALAAATGPLRTQYANARDLAERIVAGEPADVFASASLEHPRALHAAGLAGAPRPFASNRLVVAVPAASAARGSDVLTAARSRVVIEVEGIPLGDYTRALLARLDDLAGPGFAAAALANVVSEEQTVDAVAARLLDGQADAAVLYATDVAARAGLLRAIELPAAAAVAVTYAACTVLASARLAGADAWIEALAAPPALAILRDFGFDPPAAPCTPSA